MNVPNQALETSRSRCLYARYYLFGDMNQESGAVGVLPNPLSPSQYKAARITTGSAFDDFNLPLDKVDHIIFEGNMIKRIDLLNAGWAGDVDFRKKTADDIQSHKVQPV